MINSEKAQAAIRMLLEAVGEDADREGLVETPDRVARMYTEILEGMDEDPSIHLAKTFESGNNGLVLEKDIKFYSMCEHHLMPFYGVVHIAYMPAGRVVGLSKLARTVEVYARRFQIQERMSGQIADAIMEHLAPIGCMVVIEAEHMCMTMRGVRKPGSKTITIAARGCFEDNDNLQNRILQMTAR